MFHAPCSCVGWVGWASFAALWLGVALLARQVAVWLWRRYWPAPRGEYVDVAVIRLPSHPSRRQAWRDAWRDSVRNHPTGRGAFPRCLPDPSPEPRSKVRG